MHRWEKEFIVFDLDDAMEIKVGSWDAGTFYEGEWKPRYASGLALWSTVYASSVVQISAKYAAKDGGEIVKHYGLTTHKIQEKIYDDLMGLVG